MYMYLYIYVCVCLHHYEYTSTKQTHDHFEQQLYITYTYIPYMYTYIEMYLYTIYLHSLHTRFTTKEASYIFTLSERTDTFPFSFPNCLSIYTHTQTPALSVNPGSGNVSKF